MSVTGYVHAESNQELVCVDMFRDVLTPTHLTTPGVHLLTAVMDLYTVGRTLSMFDCSLEYQEMVFADSGSISGILSNTVCRALRNWASPSFWHPVTSWSVGRTLSRFYCGLEYQEMVFADSSNISGILSNTVCRALRNWVSMSFWHSATSWSHSCVRPSGTKLMISFPSPFFLFVYM